MTWVFAELPAETPGAGGGGGMASCPLPVSLLPFCIPRRVSFPLFSPSDWQKADIWPSALPQLQQMLQPRLPRLV